jgi:hypothetical protein
MTEAGAHLTQESMHADHVAGRADHEQWNGDIVVWRSQTEGLIAGLGVIANELREHDERIRKHAWKFPRHVAALHDHEHSITELQTAGAGEQYDPGTPSHEHWNRVHAELDREHQELKKLHRTVVARTRSHIDSMMKALGDVA